MTDIRSIEPGKYNLMLAETLKKVDEFKSPSWMDFVKTGMHRERPTQEEDFWHRRAASILRQLYIREVVGVQRLRTRYGGKKDRGGKPSKFARGGGKIIRVILQQAEEAGLVEKTKIKKIGRKLTVRGKELLEGVK